MKKVPLVLASRSPRRAEILRQIGIVFKVLESTFEEKEKANAKDETEVIKLVIENAKGKALNVANKVKEGVVVGVDTLVFYNGEIIGKPKNKKNAFRILSTLSGTKHTVFSGIALVKKEKDSSRLVFDFEKTYVYMRNATLEELEEYIRSGEPLDKAGGYGIQEKGAIFMEKIEGDFSNVVGLPIPKLLKLSKELDIKIV